MIILLPTLNRIHLVQRFVDSYKETRATCPVWILVDSEDRNKHAYDILKLADGFRVIDTGSAISMGDKCRFIWPHVKQSGEASVGLLNDDHVCMTKEWDKKVEAMIDGTNMVSCNDGNWNFGTNVVGITAWSMPLLDAVGFPIFPRNLQHYFVDNVWKSIGDATGCWLETLKINFEHRHVFRGQMEADDTFKRVNDPEKTAYDQKEAQHFMDQDFAGVVERVKKLREPHSLESKFV